MFQLSKKADYGLIALKHLAQHSEESVSAREIAAHYHIPVELPAEVSQRLARKGLWADMAKRLQIRLDFLNRATISRN